MLGLPIELHSHIMRMYFTHHVLTELRGLEPKPRRTNLAAGRFVDILNGRIRTELSAPSPRTDVLKRLRYARDRWSNHLFPQREEVASVK
jgi:hypothetical protein